MSGLLSDILPFIYSKSDAAKRSIGGLLSDPSLFLQQSAGKIMDDDRAFQSKMAQAFANPKNPMQITDQSAFAGVADNALSNILGLAPVGMIAKTGGATTSLSDAKEFAELVMASQKNLVPKIIQDKGGSVYVTVQKAPLTKTGEIAKNRSLGPVDFKARFADHPQYWGASVSSDPITQNTVKDVFDAFSQKVLGAASTGKLPTKANFSPADGTGRVTDMFVQGKKPSVSGKTMVDDWVTETRPFSVNKNIR